MTGIQCRSGHVFTMINDDYKEVLRDLTLVLAIEPNQISIMQEVNNLINTK